MMSEEINFIDNVFDDEKDMSEVDEISWKKLKEARLKEGYVEGKYLGEESTLQSGFNHGYWESFEYSFPISVIQGLLAGIQMQLSDSQSELIKRCRKIKLMLDSLKEKLGTFKLECLAQDKSHDDNDSDSLDCDDENCNKPVEENSKTEGCYFSSTNKIAVFEKNMDRVKLLVEEFNAVKEEILCFIGDCNFPAVMDHVSSLCDTWDIQYVTRFSPCKSECTCVNESACTSRLLATTK